MGGACHQLRTRSNAVLESIYPADSLIRWVGDVDEEHHHLPSRSPKILSGKGRMGQGIEIHESRTKLNSVLNSVHHVASRKARPADWAGARQAPSSPFLAGATFRRSKGCMAQVAARVHGSWTNLDSTPMSASPIGSWWGCLAGWAGPRRVRYQSSRSQVDTLIFRSRRRGRRRLSMLMIYKQSWIVCP